MKTTISFTVPFYSLIMAVTLQLIGVTSVNAQNLVTNSDFAGGSSSGWSTSSSIEVNPQTTYGGPSSTIYVTEIDVERTINQQVCILPGLTYTFTFTASRRTQSGTPTSPGVNVKVTGVSSNTNYVNSTGAYSNTTWYGLTQTFNFTVASNSADRKVNIQFVSTNNSSTYGVLVWNVQLSPAAAHALSIAGPSSSLPNTGNTYYVNNSPASASYNWSFSNDANIPSSTNAMPTNISWASTGVKTVSVALSNGTCTMATYSKNVSVQITLPVTISSLTGVVVDQTGRLTWVAEKETNGRYFVIERSANGVDFDSIGRVSSVNADMAYTYQYADQAMLSGNNYYRIRHVDIDNAIYYSKTISLNNASVSNSGKMEVFPNPAGATLNYRVISSQAGIGMIQVFNTSGVMVLTGQVQLAQGVNQHAINISGLNNGSYFLKFINTSGSRQYTMTFVKG